MVQQISPMLQTQMNLTRSKNVRSLIHSHRKRPFQASKPCFPVSSDYAFPLPLFISQVL
eukprot:c35734_g1_i1 orf=2-175(-)